MASPPDLAQRRRELLRAKLAARPLRAGADDRRIRAQPRPVTGPVSWPLTSTQRRMWFLQQLDATDTSATLCRALRLRGPIDVTALRAAARDLVARHEVLRSTFHPGEGEPTQLVGVVPEEALTVLDLPRTESAEHLLHRLTRTPFDLAAEAPLRLVLARVAENEHLLVLVVHHVACDDASWRILTDQLAALYRGESGESERLQVGDVAVWQRERAGGPAEREELLYWRERLEGLAAPVAPQPDHRAGGGPQVGWCSAELDDRVDAAVREHGTRSGATPFAVLYAALLVVLHRRTGATDLAVGSPVSGRTRAELDGVVGDFGNTVVLRTSVADDPGFATLLDRAREVVTGALAHQDLPFDTVVERVAAGRSGSARTDALFRVMFLTYDDRFADGHPFGPSVEVSEVRTPAHASRFDLTVAMSRGTHGLHAESTYRAELYAENTVASLFQQMAVVLTEALTRPDLPISRLPLAGAESVASRAAPTRQPAPHLTGTEGEYAARADRIARALLAHGAGPNSAVVVALPPSADMLAAQLAVYRVGAVHVPVDPRHPPARTALVVEGVDPLVVVTEHEVADRLGAALGEAERLFVEDLPDTAPATASPARPEDAAYVIHTSGSTGRPKGVVVTRANLASMLEATAAALPVPLGPSDVWSVTHSAAFDFSVWEIWGAMAHGSRLVLVDHDTVREPRALARLLVEEGVTVLSQTPSAFAGLVAADEEDPALLAGSALRLIVFGGEPLEPELVRRWYARHPHDGPVLVNMYGITETTVHASALVLNPSIVERLPGGASGTPIGQALPGQWLDVVDPTGRPVPTGVLGELWVGGPGVSRGYLGDPARTAERFVAGPDGMRYYRSGDLARRGPDGGLLHLGRIDDQISLRGYRIEPGEVASVVAEVTGASDVVVLVVDRAGDPRLVAFVVTDAIDPARLRAGLAGRLTEPMIPSEFFAVDRLPLTTSGKVDRRALAEIAATRAPEEPGSRRSPEGPVEQTVAALFADVLGVPEASVGADDDFFTLGGHSLLAVRLASALRGAFDADVDVRTVFDAATVAGIASVVTGDQVTARPLLTARDRPEHLPVAELAHGLWFLNRLDPKSPTYHVPIEIRLRGRVDTDALRRALQDVVARHESLRTSYPRGGAAEQVILPDTPIEITEHTEITDELLEVPFDLATAPPVRLLLAPTEGGMTGVLLLHHIAADEGSLGPLLDDLGTAYTARSQGRAPEWPPLPVQYADWSLWHRELLGDGPSSERERQREHWARALAGAPERLELPLDRPRPATRDTSGGRVPLRIDPRLRRAVGRLASAHGVSTFMVLHAALATLLTRFGAGEDITVGSPVGRRTEPALNGVVGYLVNTVVLRTDTGGDPSFAELLGRVRKVALDAYANADLPFEQVVNTVAPGRSTATTPLFQVLLSYAAGALPTPAFGDLDVTVAPRATATAKFDLTLNLAEQPDADGAAAIEGVLAFRTDVFDRATADRLATALPRILTQVAAEPRRPIGDLDILGDEADRILRDWNDTLAPKPTDDVLTQITKAAAEAPTAPAVVSADGEELSYRELVERMNKLGHLLRKRLEETGEERYIGLLLPRGPALVTALLGVLASDAAFVPVDAGLPAARVAELCASLDAVVTDTATRHLLDGVPDVPVIVLDAVADELARQPAGPPPRRTGTEAPNGLRAAYVIHTSGSTGVPKSAVIVHDAIASRMTWQRAKLGLTPDDGVLHKAPLTFDISVNELLLPLTAGARLVLAEPGRHGDLAHLLDVIDGHRVSFVYLVASMLEVMLETPSVAERARSLRHLWCGGEKLTAELLMRTREALDVTLYHGYGPAETTIGVCSETHPAGERGEIAEVTLGRPNPNTVLYVLDRRLRPVPPGVGGELYVGGILLGRGYRGDPARTAERFVPDPFGTGGRLYATGDLARYRADGRLEFLGRADNQVKVRGARVELEEVESVLRGHPRVRQAAAVLLDPGASARLAVAWVPEPGPSAPDRDDVLGWLRDRLPAAAVPSVLSAVPELPLRTSGKVDRALLSSWLVETERAHALNEPVDPPRGDREELVAKVWSEVLGLPLDQVGARSGFFDLGGNSLSMVIVQQRLAEEIGREPALLDLLAHPTVADLARLLGEPEEPTVDPALSRARERAARARRAARRRRP
ncbi:non-ribosomal peptide synthetase [Pseudonocardia spinosispora]|uniref:non-ribosomal peptide synthetase n=1 Tax=Pseudonocardia spinosispora TaxID=103441 RepID=UPI0003F7EF00|nr:non-ribosomal peptide synthetase [Pseudonocardia spinosispora]